jgi:hypothetical protein
LLADHNSTADGTCAESDLRRLRACTTSDAPDPDLARIVDAWPDLPAGVQSLTFSPDGMRLASGSRDFTVLVWDVPGALGRDNTFPSEPEQCWKELADDDPRVAYRAIWRLAKVPAKSVPMLSDRMRPVPVVAQAGIDRLIAELDNARFAVREEAASALLELGEVVEPFLRKALRDSLSLEMRLRLEKLLAKTVAPVPPPERLRLLRALAALEEIGTPEARRLLESLANGAPDASLTQEAQRVLERLAKRSEKR